MNTSRILHVIRSRPAALIAATLVLIVVLGLAAALRPRSRPQTVALYTNSAPVPATTYDRPTVPVVAVQPKPPPPPAPVPVKAPTPAPTNTAKPFIGVRWHGVLPPEPNTPPLGIYAPAGRLLRCQLVNTVDSANIDTPIIVLVTDDLWHDGRLVIPAGTEVHGKASVDRLRERIVSSGAWTLVWQSGEELVIEGIALDREEYGNGDYWGITDGSAGLRGQILRSDSLAEIKLFVATFMAGAAAGLKEQRTTLFGDQIARTARNSALEGAGQVMNTYAQQILDTIHREGLFCRVAAGKQMYLYITCTVDVSQAKRGNLRRATMPTPPFSRLSAASAKP
jgi:hypothetical protein